MNSKFTKLYKSSLSNLQGLENLFKKQQQQIRKNTLPYEIFATCITLTNLSKSSLEKFYNNHSGVGNFNDYLNKSSELKEYFAQHHHCINSPTEQDRERFKQMWSLFNDLEKYREQMFDLHINPQPDPTIEVKDVSYSKLDIFDNIRKSSNELHSITQEMENKFYKVFKKQNKYEIYRYLTDITEKVKYYWEQFESSRNVEHLGKYLFNLDLFKKQLKLNVPEYQLINSYEKDQYQKINNHLKLISENGQKLKLKQPEREL